MCIITYYVVTLNANERHIFTLFIDNKKSVFSILFFATYIKVIY